MSTLHLAKLETQTTTTTSTTSTTTPPATSTTTAAPTTTAPVADLVSVQASTSTITAGSTVVVTGSGFRPGSSVKLSLHSNPIALGSATVGSATESSFVAVIPATTPLGNHHVEVVGTSALGVPATSSIELAVTAAASTTTAVVEPNLASELAFTGAADPLTATIGALTIVSGVLLWSGRLRRSRSERRRNV